MNAMPSTRSPVLTGKERLLDPDGIVVSKTNIKGLITYANQTFLEMAGYSEKEVIGKPHNIVRHPDMPHSVFKLLWDTIGKGNEIFAYVINRAKNGDHYWVFAHVTPIFEQSGSGAIVGYHSSRRCPQRKAVETVIPVYRELCDEEARHANAKQGAEAALELLNKKYIGAGGTYEDLVFSL